MYTALEFTHVNTATFEQDYRFRIFYWSDCFSLLDKSKVSLSHLSRADECFKQWSGNSLRFFRAGSNPADLICNVAEGTYNKKKTQNKQTGICPAIISAVLSVMAKQWNTLASKVGEGGGISGLSSIELSNPRNLFGCHGIYVSKSECCVQILIAGAKLFWIIMVCWKDTEIIGKGVHVHLWFY